MGRIATTLRRFLGHPAYPTLLRIALGYGVLIALLWGATLWEINQEYEQALAGEVVKNSNLAQAHEERTVRSLQLLDQTLLTLRSDHSLYGVPRDLNRRLAELQVDRKYVGVVSLIGAKGEVIATTAAGMTDNFADREYFKTHKADAADRMLIGKPIRGRFTGNWLISLTRRLNRPDGTFAGVVFMALDPNFLARDSLDTILGPQASIAIIGLDYITRVRRNSGKVSFGEDVRASQLFKEIPRARVGHYSAVAASDGVTRIASYRVLEDYPLVMLVASSLQDVQALLAPRNRSYRIVASIGSLLLLVLGAMLVTAIARRFHSLALLSASEQRYRGLIDWSPEPFIVSRDEKIVFANPAALRLLRATKARELVGRSLFDFIHPDFHALAHERLACLADGQVLPTVEQQYLALDGSVVDVEVKKTMADFEGAPAVHIVVRDITDRKQGEVRREALEAQLRESQKMQAIGTLAGGIAHDFNNALATILGNARLATEDAAGNARVLESLEEITKAGRRSRDLVRQILSFSRRQPMDRKPIPLGPVLEEAARLLRATLPARLVFNLDCDADVPPVLADATQIEQVIINLATNSMHAMPHGPGRIGLRLDTVPLDPALVAVDPMLQAMHGMSPGRVARIVVEDTGQGMDADTAARIFEPFFTTKPVNEGTGLGLSVVYGIVQSHNGAISVHSEPGKGSVFTIYLPLAAPTENTAAA